MKPMLLTDYILGNAFSKKYKGTIIEQLPYFIFDLPNIQFTIDKNGNYKYPEVTDITKPFIYLSSQNIALGNFFIIFQKYMKKPVNIIQEQYIPNHNIKINITDDFFGYLKPNNITDVNNDIITDLFFSFNPKLDEVILMYFFKSGQLGYFRNKISQISLSRKIEHHHIEILNILLYFYNNKKHIQEVKDNIKKKYKGKFTEQSYFLI